MFHFVRTSHWIRSTYMSHEKQTLSVYMKPFDYTCLMVLFYNCKHCTQTDKQTQTSKLEWKTRLKWRCTDCLIKMGLNDDGTRRGGLPHLFRLIAVMLKDLFLFFINERRISCTMLKISFTYPHLRSKKPTESLSGWNLVGLQSEWRGKYGTESQFEREWQQKLMIMVIIVIMIDDKNECDVLKFNSKRNLFSIVKRYRYTNNNNNKE